MEAKEAYAHIVHLLEAMNSCVSQVVQCLALEDDSTESIEDLEASLHFNPAKGNVLFSSALHALFGDFYISGGKIKGDASSRGKTPLFVQLVLEPLWALHDCGLVTNDMPKLLELTGKIGLKLNFLPRFAPEHHRPGPRFVTDTGHSIWLAIGPIIHSKNAIQECSRAGLTVVLVVKFISVEGQKFAVCRVFSGHITAGDELYMIGRKALSNGSVAPKVTIDSVCALHGRDLVPLNVATAGVNCAVKAQGLIQNATLCSDAVYEGLDVGMKHGEPLVRVSVSTVNLEDMERLREDLKSLAILDSSLRVLELDNGELAMITAGEVHLQKCLKDLEDLGFRDLEISKPIVPFLETLVADTKLTVAQIQDQVTECRLRDGSLYIRLRVVPLPDEIVNILEESADLLSAIKRGNVEDRCLAEFKSALLNLCEKHLPQYRGSWWYRKSSVDITQMVDKIWSFGPDRARANVLFNAIPNYDRKSLWDSKCEFGIRPLDQAMVSGFELFVSAGPLCHEVMRGVAVVVEEWMVDEEDVAVAGQLMTAMRSTCQAGAKKVALRLVAAMYRCTVTTAVQALGKVHSVLAQRRGKVLNEDVNEATGQYEVTALIPVIETFSFCDHLRKNTSGMASAQLEFSHWQLIDEDPYWQPTTLEEMEEYGIKGDSPNHARGYMDAIRRRKGLPTDDVIVVSAEKQRNLSKNK
ncbi:hypothetical protein KIN20_020690 [Parelaphostrongylus tenuis]|uniref:Elongation factor-like 1 n=1 Tax=Parelaphostrongylus tenuis TaxID=148309 RepID=A0AAD5MT53_PARTN|nr:hypothetical protein KIN20_020690 [Parelaphostrongylus tenuis]